MSILHHDFKDSTMLASADYNTEEKELQISFIAGRQYTYTDVPKDIYDSLTNTQSAGKYFNSIKNGLTIK